MVHTELARTCDVKYARTAIPLLTRAISAGGEETSRSQSFRLAALAMNYLVQNETEHARDVGEQAIEVSGPIRSARTRDRMRPLKQEADRLRGNEAADDLSASARGVHERLTGSGLTLEASPGPEERFGLRAPATPSNRATPRWGAKMPLRLVRQQRISVRTA